MAVEKFIRGKADSAHHAGRFCNEKRKQASEARINEYYTSEHDPEGIDFVSFDPYTDNLANIVYEAKREVKSNG